VTERLPLENLEASYFEDALGEACVRAAA